MLRIAMGTAAALLSVGVVNAQEWSLDIGGFFMAGLGYVSAGNNEGDVGMVRDPELLFSARLVADNGITIGVRTEVELADERPGGAANIDENFIFVSGRFGRFEFGEADGAKDAFHYMGMVKGPWASAGDTDGFLFDDAFYGDEVGNRLDAFTDTSDDLKITFLTPKFSGFSAGVSFVPATNDNGRASNLDDDEGFEIGAGYGANFGDVSVGIGGGWAEQGDAEYYGGSAKAGYAGFELGVAFGDTDDGSGDEQFVYQIGLAYETGPWTIGGDYAAEEDGIGGSEQSGLTVGVSYALAPGVALGVGAERHDADLDDVDESYAAGTWLDLRF